VFAAAAAIVAGAAAGEPPLYAAASSSADTTVRGRACRTAETTARAWDKGGEGVEWGQKQERGGSQVAVVVVVVVGGWVGGGYVCDGGRGGERGCSLFEGWTKLQKSSLWVSVG